MKKNIKDLTTQEIIETCIYAQREWVDEYSKTKMLEVSRRELKRRFDTVLEMLDDRPERMITDGTKLFKNVLLKEY